MSSGNILQSVKILFQTDTVYCPMRVKFKLLYPLTSQNSPSILCHKNEIFHHLLFKQINLLHNSKQPANLYIKNTFWSVFTEYEQKMATIGSL